TQLSYPSQSPMEIAQAARTLFLTRYSWNMPVRSLTVTGINLVPSDQPTQLDMFGDEQRRMRRQKLEDCVDEIRNRFGKRAIFSAALMGELNMPDDGRHEVTMPGMMYS
ncbi:MAG: DNA polymerase IV, partial [Christensenellales bacterium]